MKMIDGFKNILNEFQDYFFPLIGAKLIFQGCVVNIITSQKNNKKKKKREGD